MSRRARSNFNNNLENLRKEGFYIEKIELEMSEVCIVNLTTNFGCNINPVQLTKPRLKIL